MATELYFDTARLGRMCSGAQKAEQDFSKLASQLGSSLYFEQFLVAGSEALPDRVLQQAPALSCWRGVAGLQQGLAEFVALPSRGSVQLAGQSRTLISLAGECLFSTCRRVLATDLEWPPYLALLKAAALRHGKELRVAPVRQRVIGRACTRSDLIALITDAYFRNGCDGLFLSDISHTGVLLPYEEILRRISGIRPPQLVVIDGAQALGQRPVRLDDEGVDLYLAGTQKWFGAYYPLRLAFISPSAQWAEVLFNQLLTKRLLRDPLSEFCRAVSSNSWPPHGETVNLSALITASGALHDWTQSSKSITAKWNARRANRRLVIGTLAPIIHSPIDESLASGTLLVTVKGLTGAMLHSRTTLREALGRELIVASEPLRGMIRLAMPEHPLSPATLGKLRHAFERVRDSLSGESITANRSPFHPLPLGISTQRDDAKISS